MIHLRVTTEKGNLTGAFILNGQVGTLTDKINATMKQAQQKIDEFNKGGTLVEIAGINFRFKTITQISEPRVQFWLTVMASRLEKIALVHSEEIDFKIIEDI